MTKRNLYSELIMALQEAKDHSEDKASLTETKMTSDDENDEGDTDGKVE